MDFNSKLQMKKATSTRFPLLLKFSAFTFYTTENNLQSREHAKYGPPNVCKQINNVKFKTISFYFCMFVTAITFL